MKRLRYHLQGTRRHVIASSQDTQRGAAGAAESEQDSSQIK
jgi:hypothetical protein